MLNRERGITLMEFAATIGLAAVFSVVALPVASSFVDRARNNRAIGDIGVASLQIHQWQQENGSLPRTLEEAGIEMQPDPWGREYVYTNTSTPVTNRARKTAQRANANTDFDLYSLGRDGETTPLLTASPSRDDIVRTDNGRFIGPVGNLLAPN